MKRLGIAVAVIALAFSLSGCEFKSNFDKCVDAGGSYEANWHGGHCWMNGEEQS